MSDSGNPYDPLNTTSSSGVTISTDGTMADDSDDNVSTEKAVKTYVDAQVASADTLAELTDTDITSPVALDMLIYDGSDSWDNVKILDEDDMASDSNTQVATQQSIKKYVDDLILTAIYPVNTIFVQWPIAESNTVATAFPSAQAPATLYGGTWSQIYEDEAVFFRTEGTYVEASQDTDRTNGMQTMKFQGHRFNINTGGSTLEAPGAGGNTYIPSVAAGGGGDFYAYTIITDGTNGTPLAGKETRPVNRIIRLWKRTA